MPVAILHITEKTEDWPSALGKAVRQADDHTIIAVDSSEKAALAHTAAARLGKVVRVEIHQ